MLEKLHEEFDSLYYSPNITRVMTPRRASWVVHVARMIKIRNANSSGKKPKGKRSLGRRKCRYEDTK
jgi:hypothetical protein